jgi:hypothetical protein
MTYQKSGMLSAPPTVELLCGEGVPYATLVQQTKMVYDNLLADKYGKLMDQLLQQKAQFDAECNRLEQKDAAKAIGYGIKSQDTLNKMSKEAENELKIIHVDYQNKMNNMCQQMAVQFNPK